MNIKVLHNKEKQVLCISIRAFNQNRRIFAPLGENENPLDAAFDIFSAAIKGAAITGIETTPGYPVGDDFRLVASVAIAEGLV